MNAPEIKFPRSDWSQVLAFAWWTTEPDTTESVFLDALRKNPKIAINELSKGEQGAYRALLLKVEIPETREGIVNAALTIQQQANEDPTGDYRGYLPIPSGKKVGALADLDRNKLADLLRKGIAGILEFDDPGDPEQANLWSQELLKAWKDDEYLIEILRDPADKLRDKGLKSILPLPDRPRGLEELEIGKLQNFLGDQDNMEHLGGIFLFGS